MILSFFSSSFCNCEACSVIVMKERVGEREREGGRELELELENFNHSRIVALGSFGPI